MANGREPQCAICLHFGREHPDAPPPRIIGDPTNKCVCALHKVVLPYSDTSDLLICRDWVDYKSKRRLIDWSNASRYKSGVLYSYTTIYSPETSEVSPLVQLESFPGAVPITNDG
jgi:hypothetical protein